MAVGRSAHQAATVGRARNGRRVVCPLAADSARAAVLLGVVFLQGALLDAAEPFFDAKKHRSEYAGPGRETAEPTGVAEVKIGYFGPYQPPLGKSAGGAAGASPASENMDVDLYRAATMAIEEANAEGGYRGKPFRLLPAWSGNPWTAGARLVTQLVYQEQVWALIGGIDGPTAHLAEQVAAKARVSVLSPASSDRSANLANVPWMFSLLPGDHLQAPPLVQSLSRTPAKANFVLISADDHDARHFAGELTREFARRQISPRYQYVCRPADRVPLVARALADRPLAVVVVGDASASGELVLAIRESGFRGPIYGTPAMGRRAFLARAEGKGPLLYPIVCDPGDALGRFTAAFQKRHGQEPDFAAASAYDAARILIAAIRQGGLNRARIGDAIRRLSPYPGVCGPIRWDTLGSNSRAVRMSDDGIRVGRE